MSVQRTTGGRRKRISRDMVFWLVGLGLMIYHGFGLSSLFGQEPQFNLFAFLGGMVISGAPMGWNFARLMTGHIDGPQSESPPDSPSPVPSSPSPGG